MEQFTKCVKGQITMASGSRLAMDYKIYDDDNILPVCKKSFAKAHNISSYLLEKCSEAYRLNTEAIFLNGQCSIRECHIPDLTYAQIEDVFIDNVTDFNPSTDKKMVRAVLTSISSAQQRLVSWLEDHFELYGDKTPNRDETHMIIMQKTEVYRQYVADVEREIEVQPCQYSLFIETWKCLFPTCLSRPWCEIIGKCDTCCDINQLRRGTTDRSVQKALVEAHSLHRGGMFMLERSELALIN
jgi:hypothetical protein